MARQTFSICNVIFKSKASLEEASKRIRDSYPLCASLSPKDQAFIEEVFRQLYPKDSYAEKKLGTGVKKIQVIDTNRGHSSKPSRCFQFHLTNGGVEEPSLRYCFSPLSKATEVKEAFRFAIVPSKSAYLKKYYENFADSEGKAPCELSGQRTLSKDADVDHKEPNTFQKILENFCCLRHVDLLSVETKYTPFNRGFAIADSALAKDWVSYHDSNVQYRVLSRAVHVHETQKSQKLASDKLQGKA
jgi:hypothetical protein